MISEGHAQRGSTRLHYLMHRGDPNLTPLVYVPGTLGNAGDFKDEMIRLAPRTTVAISPRGLGKSSASGHGYSLGDRTDDLQAVLNQLSLRPACVMAFSAGVPIAINYAIKQPDRVKALILLDYPAATQQLTDRWVEQARPFAEKLGVPEQVIQAMVRESATIGLWHELPLITCPVLLIKGGRSPYVTEDELTRYKQALPHLRLEIFEDSGHEVFRPNYERFMQTIESFLLELG